VPLWWGALPLRFIVQEAFALSIADLLSCTGGYGGSMSAESLGARLLAEVHEETLDEVRAFNLVSAPISCSFPNHQHLKHQPNEVASL